MFLLLFKVQLQIHRLHGWTVNTSSTAFSTASMTVPGTPLPWAGRGRCDLLGPHGYVWHHWLLPTALQHSHTHQRSVSFQHRSSGWSIVKCIPPAKTTLAGWPSPVSVPIIQDVSKIFFHIVSKHNYMVPLRVCNSYRVFQKKVYTLGETKL